MQGHELVYALFIRLRRRPALMVRLRCSGLFFIGDDETDEDVFGLTEGLMMGVRVGHQAESLARYYLKHQSEIEEVIRFLVRRLDRTPEFFTRGW